MLSYSQSLLAIENDDIVVLSLDEAGIQLPNEAVDLEAKLTQLESELQKAKENVAKQEKLRIKYYNQHSATKKDWQSKNLNLRKEVFRLQEEKKASEADLNLYERMLGTKDQQLSEKDVEIQQLKTLLQQKEKMINQAQTEYLELLDNFLSLSVENQKLSGSR